MDDDTRCSCEVVRMPAASPLNQYHEVKFCPMHAAAREMLETLKEIVSLRGFTDPDIAEIAREAIAKATKAVP